MHCSPSFKRAKIRLCACTWWVISSATGYPAAKLPVEASGALSWELTSLGRNKEPAPLTPTLKLCHCTRLFINAMEEGRVRLFVKQTSDTELGEWLTC